MLTATEIIVVYLRLPFLLRHILKCVGYVVYKNISKKKQFTTNNFYLVSTDKADN